MDPIKTKLLLTKDANVNQAGSDGDTPLHQCARGLHAVNKKILAHQKSGASNIHNRFSERADSNFIISRALGAHPKVDVMKELQGVYDALLVVSQQLVKAGADLNLKNRQGKTAYDIATKTPELLGNSDTQHLKPGVLLLIELPKPANPTQNEPAKPIQFDKLDGLTI